MKKQAPRIIAHRGVPNALPGNTFESIHAALQLPIFGIEFDVDLTKDGVPILFHQSTFPANPSFTGIELGPRVLHRHWTHDHTFAEIEHFDVGSWLDPKFSHMRFTTLDAILNLDWGAVQACIELKNPYFYTDEDSSAFGAKIVDIASPIISDFISRGGSAQLIFFDPKTLQLAERKFPMLERNLAIECFDPVDPYETALMAKDVGATGLILVDNWIRDDLRWRERADALQLSLWAYELTPDKDQLAQQDNAEATLHAGWQSIYELGIQGLHCDFPYECYCFFEQLARMSNRQAVC